MINKRSAQALASNPSTPTTIQATSDSHTMTFANGSNASTNNVLNITSNYRPAIFADKVCPHNLIPEKALSDLNCATTFYQNTCTITPPVSSNLKTIVIRRDPNTALFHANLEEIHSLIQDLEEHYGNDSYPPESPCHSCHDAFSAVLQHYNHQTIEYKVIDLHEKMGHPPCEAMCAAVSGDNPAWINSGITASQIRHVFNKYTCIPCAAAKKNLNPPVDRSKEDRRKWLPGECFSCDPAVKINPQGFDGSDCFFLFKDLSTGYLYTVFTESKKASAFIEAFKEVLSHFAHYHCAPASILRTDSEAIFLSAEVNTFLTERNMKLQTSAPDCHFQVSVERDMQTVFKALSTMLNSNPYLRYDLWPLALHEYIERKNRTPNKRCFPLSPHQVVTKSSTDLAHEFCFKFGDVVLAGVADRLRDSKFDPKNEVGIYIGQAPGTTNAHRILLPHNNKIRINGSVSKLDADDKQLDKWIARRKNSTVADYGEVINDAIINLIPPIEETPTLITTTAAPTAPVASQSPAPNHVPQPSNSPIYNDIVTKFFGEEIMSEFTPDEHRMMVDTQFLLLLEKYATILANKIANHSKGFTKPRPDTPPPNPPNRRRKTDTSQESSLQPTHHMRRRSHQVKLCLHNVHYYSPRKHHTLIMKPFLPSIVWQLRRRTPHVLVTQTHPRSNKLCS